MKFSIFFKNSLLLLLMGSFMLTSCDEDPDMGPDSPYTDGVFILNQGGFQTATASVSFLARDSNVIRDNIFQLENGGKLLGDVAQSISIYENEVYIVVNNSNKVEVVDSDHFTSVATITGVELPRYMVFRDDKGYLSQWGADGRSGSVAVINLETYEVENTIACGSGPEQMLIVSDKLYVANTGGFGQDSTVAVIDLRSEVLEKNIVVGDGPNSMQRVGTDLYVICGGVYDADFNLSDGAFVRLSNDQVVASQPVSGNAQFLTKGKTAGITTDLYYKSNAGIFQVRVNPDINGLPAATRINDFFYFAIGFEHTSGKIWAADATDFSSPGSVLLITPDGVFAGGYQVGIAPVGFAFKD